MIFEQNLPHRYKDSASGGSGKNSDVWLGPDAQSLETITIQSGHSGFVPVDVTPLSAAIPEKEIDFLEIVTRSRIAQLGGEIRSNTATVITNALKKPGIVNIEVVNYSKAPLEIPGGKICRLISRHGPYVSGDDLLDFIEQDKIKLGGEQNDQWWIHRSRSGKPIGVGMLLNPIEEWIPPRATPVTANGRTRESFRRDLAAALRPIQHGDKPVVRIGETAVKLGLPDDIFGYIDPLAGALTEYANVRIANKQHLNARALYPGDHWEIRTETRSTNEELSTPPEQLKRKAIIVTFARV